MKTVEEKAKEYAVNKFWGVCELPEFDYSLIDNAEEDFTAGHNEAMRWRDPSELPLGYKSDFLIKYESGEIRRFEEDTLFDIITHWRPIK